LLTVAFCLCYHSRVDLPGTGDFNVQKQRALEEELEKDMQLFVVVLDDRGFNDKDVVDMLSKWKGVAEWEEGTPLPVAAVVSTKDQSVKATLAKDFMQTIRKQRLHLVKSSAMRSTIPDKKRRVAFAEALCSRDDANCRLFFADPQAFAKSLALLRQRTEGTREQPVSDEMRRFLGLVTQISKVHMTERLREARGVVNNLSEADLFPPAKKVNWSGLANELNAKLEKDDSWSRVPAAITSNLERAQMKRESTDAVLDALTKCLAKREEQPAGDAQASAISTRATQHRSRLFDCSPIRPRANTKSNDSEAEVGKVLHEWNSGMVECLLEALREPSLDEERAFLNILKQGFEEILQIPTGDIQLDDEFAAIKETQVIAEARKYVRGTLRSALVVGSFRAFNAVISDPSLTTERAAREMLSNLLHDAFAECKRQLVSALPPMLEEFRRKTLGPMGKKTRRCLTYHKIQSIRSLQSEPRTQQDRKSMLLQRLDGAIAKASESQPTLKEEGTPVVDGIISECVREGVRGLHVFGLARTLNLPRDTTPDDECEDFDPSVHLDMLNAMRCSVKSLEGSLNREGRQLLRVQKSGSRRKGKPLRNLLASVEVYGSSVKISDATFEKSLNLFTHKWGHYLKTRNAAIRDSWDQWPEWLKQLTTLVDLYGRVANVYVCSAGAEGEEDKIRIIRIKPITAPDRHQGRADAIALLRERHPPTAEYTFGTVTCSEILPLETPSATPAASDPGETAPTRNIDDELVNCCVLNRDKFPSEFVADIKDHTRKDLVPHFGSYALHLAADARKKIGSQDACDIAWSAGCVVLCDGVGDTRMIESGEWARQVKDACIKIAKEDDSPLLSATNRARRIGESAMQSLMREHFVLGSTTLVISALARLPAATGGWLHCMCVGDSVATILRRQPTGTYRCEHISTIGWVKAPRWEHGRITQRGTPCQLVSGSRGHRRLIAMPEGATDHIWKIQEGDVLVTFSDGIGDNLGVGSDHTERDIRAQLDKILSAMTTRPGQSICEAVRAQLIGQVKEQERQERLKNDDMALVCVEIHVGGEIAENHPTDPSAPPNEEEEPQAHGLSNRRAFVAQRPELARGSKRAGDESNDDDQSAESQERPRKSNKR
jgi:serine/threonine protein phosphatase PrpC